MNSFSWMIRRYTGASADLSPDELKQLERRCNEMFVASKRRFWMIILLTVITTGLASTIGGQYLAALLASLTGWSQRWCQFGCTIGISVLSIAIWLHVYTLLYVRPLRRALTELGYAVCEQCGYSLRELAAETKRCPECGAESIVR